MRTGVLVFKAASTDNKLDDTLKKYCVHERGNQVFRNGKWVDIQEHNNRNLKP